MTMVYSGVYRSGVTEAVARVLREYADTKHTIHVDSKKTQLLSCKKSRRPIVTCPHDHFYVSPAVYCPDCGATLEVRI